jgi:hypothetical protein
LPKLESFSEVKGYYSLKDKGLIKKDILTLVDFSLISKFQKILLQELSLFQRFGYTEMSLLQFSNAAESYKSSLGFMPQAKL